jgi:chromosome segregation ATPase
MEKMNEHCRELEIWLEHSKLENEKLRSKNERLQSELKQCNKEFGQMIETAYDDWARAESYKSIANTLASELEEVGRENERLREALQFYADHSRYNNDIQIDRRDGHKDFWCKSVRTKDK